MASRCVSAISALHPSGFRSDIADTHIEAMLYITYYRSDFRTIYKMNNLTTNGVSCYHYTIYIIYIYIYIYIYILYVTVIIMKIN